jgi:2-phospho-L-lactate/phosphoenolpyruvate guanylyltransferase
MRGMSEDRPVSAAVLIPVKAFGSAKRRLSPALDAADRRRLARDLATQVLEAAGSLPVAVVCDDVEVADWARQHGARVIIEPGRGLNGAVAEGVHQLAASGFEMVIIAHADLPLARDLAWVAGFDGVTIVPDRHDDGTNVLGVPATGAFRFGYGPASFRRHVDEARRLGLPVRIIREAHLGWDIDVPADLQVLSARG